MAGALTTHVLDTALGMPAASIPVSLYRVGAELVLLCSILTNADGRCDAPLLHGPDFAIGRYELRFAMGKHLARYHSALPEPPFLDEIAVRFGVADAARHYHVPLLVSPYAFSTYRGS